MIDIVHHILCRHRVEIEVWPPRAEVFFQDERYANPINTQVRFEAILYNVTVGGVTWEVRDLQGNPGAGSIDASGLYQAPPKGSLPSGTTDVVVAIATEDPLRKAYAWVTLVGEGPAPKPQASITLTPRSATLYYPENRAGHDDRNQFIDVSNTMQMFRATLRDSATTEVEWLVDGGIKTNPAPSSLFLYEAPTSGSSGAVHFVTARIKAEPGVAESAKVVLINYQWPKIV
jgi:hypothetical protein